jgi:hypothetical protein
MVILKTRFNFAALARLIYLSAKMSVTFNYNSTNRVISKICYAVRPEKLSNSSAGPTRLGVDPTHNTVCNLYVLLFYRICACKLVFVSNAHENTIIQVPG